MNQATQQTPPTPAQRLAAKIRARTNDTRDILDLLHDIAQGGHDATEHDKLTATGILFDRGYGKCPKSAPDTGSAPNLDPETDDDDVEPAPYSIRGANRESPPAAAHKEPESPGSSHSSTTPCTSPSAQRPDPALSLSKGHRRPPVIPAFAGIQSPLTPLTTPLLSSPLSGNTSYLSPTTATRS